MSEYDGVERAESPGTHGQYKRDAEAYVSDVLHRAIPKLMLPTRRRLIASILVYCKENNQGLDVVANLVAASVQTFAKERNLSLSSAANQAISWLVAESHPL